MNNSNNKNKNNNSNTVNNNDIDNYKYYKLIFGNIYLKSCIFKFIDGTGLKYDSIFDIGHLINYDNSIKKELFKDLVKTKRVFTKFTIKKFQYLLLGLSGEGEEYEELVKQFYRINSKHIIEMYTINKDNDMFLTIISSKCGFLLPLVYDDYIQLRSLPDIQKSYNDKPTFRNILYLVGNSNSHYEIVFKNGDIKSLDFIYKTIKIPFDFNEFQEKQNLIQFVCTSSNRNKVLEYILDEMNYSIPRDYKWFSSEYNHSYLKYLNLNVLKRLLYFNSSIKDTDLIPTNFQIYSFDLNGLSLEYVLNFIQTSIYISIFRYTQYKSTQISNFKFYLLKIQLLINYQQEEEEKEKNKIKDQLIKIQNDHLNNWGNYISSMFSKISNSSATILSLSFSTTLPFSKMTETNFYQFNLEREVTKIYIVDFLIIDNKVHLKSFEHQIQDMILKYSIKFKDYQLLDELKQHNTFIKAIGGEEIFITNSFHTAFRSADIQLLNYSCDNFTKLQSIQSIPFFVDHIINYLFDCHMVPIESQINFLKAILSQSNIYSFTFSTILVHIFSQNQQLSIQSLDNITFLIEEYYIKIKNDQKCKDNLPVYILYAKQCFEYIIYGEYISNYYKNIGKLNLFNDWNQYSNWKKLF